MIDTFSIQHFVINTGTDENRKQSKTFIRQSPNFRFYPTTKSTTCWIHRIKSPLFDWQFYNGNKRLS